MTDVRTRPDTATFGDRSTFAIEITLIDDPHGDDRAPADSVGSWSRWSIWMSGINLSRLQMVTASDTVVLDGTYWYVAPLLRWLTANWAALLHETRLPGPVRRGGTAAPRWARSAYLAMVELVGDDDARFEPWHAWGCRHALRFGAEGGILPDLFFQRIGDQIEVSWGDRVEVGTESIMFLTEDGAARAAVPAVGAALSGAIDWMVTHPRLAGRDWMMPIAAAWGELSVAPGPEIATTGLAWYLDAAPQPGRLTRMLERSVRRLGQQLEPVVEGRWIERLSPAVAMFGAVAPTISFEAATAMLGTYYAARARGRTETVADTLAEDEPAWAAGSPWDNGYMLAQDILDRADRMPNAVKTHLEMLLSDLGVHLHEAALGTEGPRGVAMVGPDIDPLIVVNSDHIANVGQGQRFTIAHELCHILFDRDHARELYHSSTPWAPLSIEQRANAFAAMLLMPRHRARIDGRPDIASLKTIVKRLAATLGVGQSALRMHLLNIGEISPYQFEQLSGQHGGH